jgi:hypothetical protein
MIMAAKRDPLAENTREEWLASSLIAAANSHAELVEALGGLVHLVSEAAELLHDNGYRETSTVLRAAVADARAALKTASPNGTN